MRKLIFLFVSILVITFLVTNLDARIYEERLIRENPADYEPDAALIAGNTDDYPEIMWYKDLDAPSFGSAAVDDIDNDGYDEIVFGTYFNDENIYALNSEDGSVLWTFFTDGCNDASPVIYDVDLDGQLEVIVPASQSGIVYCLDGTNGNVEWSRSTGYCIDSPPSIADVDNDNRREIIVGTFLGNVFCLNGEDGSVEWQVNLGSNSYIQSCPGIVDVDDDGQLDIIVAQWSGDSRVYALKGDDGSTLWYSDEPTDWIYHGASIADIDEDGKPEIAIGCYDGNVYVFNAEDGSLEWSHSEYYYVGAPTSVADLNNDGHLEIVYVSYNKVGVLSYTGNLLWSYNVGGNVFRGVAIADIDDDGFLDLLFGCDDEILRALRGSDGSVIWSYDLGQHYGNTFEIDHAPVIGDFDNNGELDVFCIGGYGTSSNPQNNHGRAYALTAGSGGGEGWTMFRHDRKRTSNMHYMETPVEIVMVPFEDWPFGVWPGATIYYDGILINNTDFNAYGDVWVMITPEDGSPYGPLQVYQSVPLSSRQTIIINDIPQEIPVWAPLTLYTYTAYAGFYPNLVIDSSFFQFYVDLPISGTSDDWNLSGWFDEPSWVPSKMSLGENYPNPFNSSTVISFTLPEAAEVALEVYNLKGQLVDIIAKSNYLPGRHEVIWDASRFASGVYFYSLSTGDKILVRKMILLK